MNKMNQSVEHGPGVYRQKWLCAAISQMSQICAAKSTLRSLIEAPLESRDVVAAHWLSWWLGDCKEMYISKRVIVVCHNQCLFVGFAFLTKQLFEVFGRKLYLDLRGVLAQGHLPCQQPTVHRPTTGTWTRRIKIRFHSFHTKNKNNVAALWWSEVLRTELNANVNYQRPRMLPNVVLDACVRCGGGG